MFQKEKMKQLYEPVCRRGGLAQAEGMCGLSYYKK
jgi:hypothetical protein